jgi:hypothetical protein
MVQNVAQLLRQRKTELEEAKERQWAELNQILGAISAIDGLLAELATDNNNTEEPDDSSNLH